MWKSFILHFILNLHFNLVYKFPTFFHRFIVNDLNKNYLKKIECKYGRARQRCLLKCNLFYDITSILCSIKKPIYRIWMLRTERDKKVHITFIVSIHPSIYLCVFIYELQWVSLNFFLLWLRRGKNGCWWSKWHLLLAINRIFLLFLKGILNTCF